MLRLRRITSRGEFLSEVDGLRFIAIASVVLYHFHGFYAAEAGRTAAWVDALAGHGYRGVNLFYVLSGFLLGLPFAAQALAGAAPVSLRRYFLRRLTRLEPPYVLNLLVCHALAPAATGAGLAASLLYLHSLIYGAQNPANPVTWTLEVEVQFYCLAPVLALVFRIPSATARRLLLAALIVLAGILQLVWWEAPVRVRLSLLFAIQFFLAGFLLADLYVTDWKRAPGKHWLWDVAALACWPVIFLAGDRTVWVLLPALMLLAAVAAFRGPASSRLLSVEAITIVGGMCYSIYLFHYVLIPPVLHAARLPFAAHLVFYCLVTLAVSTAWFVLIERPCMRPDWPGRLRAFFQEQPVTDEAG